MHFLDLPCLSRIYNVLQIAGLVLFLGCQSDSIVLNPPGGYEYQFHSFPIDINNSQSFQFEPMIGSSSRLYTGIINNHDIVYTLLQLLPDNINDHDVCNADIKDSVSISLFTLDTIATQDGDSFSALFDEDSFNIYSVNSAEPWTVESNIDPNAAVTIINEAIESAALEFTFQEKALIIEFPNDGETISQWCENSSNGIGLLISYLPDAENIDEDRLSYIEFYSSDINFNVEKKPKLNFWYKNSGDTTYEENSYLIDLVSLGENPANLVKPYMIIHADSANWGRVFAFNLPEDEPEPVLSNFFKSIQDTTTLVDIISEDQINLELKLININITRNSSYDEFDTMDSITFWLDNAIAFKSAIDPAGDNYIEVDGIVIADTTEGNGQWDSEDLNGDGLISPYYFNGAWYYETEKFYDYGIDGCVDSLECGDLYGENKCIADESCSVSPYNPDGTEDDGNLNWEDKDDDDLWSIGDFGEPWWDWGTDWCPDSLEDGNGPCLADTVSTGSRPCNCLPNLNLAYNPTDDPNGDNVDPVGDDWNEIHNPTGTEMNLQWDSGEPFHDWGTDGVPASFAGYSDADSSEGNGIWDDGETFYDTGSDGEFTVNEIENYSSNNRTEGNFVFDLGERFLDCGEGLDQFDLDLDCEDFEDDCYCLEDDGDDQNLDPNNDNWSQDNEDDNRTEGNGAWDSEDLDGNGTITAEEAFEDWGYDRLSDNQEVFLYSQLLLPANEELHLWPDDESKFDMLINDNHPIQNESQHNPGSDIAEIWISDIKKIDSSSGLEQWKIVISVNTPVALKGIEFTLKHTSFTWDDTVPLSYQDSISEIEEKKLYQDITLQPNMTVPDDDSLKNNLIINYSRSLATILNFDGLKDTLDTWEEVIFSHEYSNLVMYIDTVKSDIHDDGMWLFLGYTDIDSIHVSADADSIKFPVSQIMAGFQNGSNGTYQNFKLMTNSILYNYSTLSILFNSDQPAKNPQLEIMYIQ